MSQRTSSALAGARPAVVSGPARGKHLRAAVRRHPEHEASDIRVSRLAASRAAGGERAYVWTAAALFLTATGLALFDTYQFVSLVT